MTDMKRTTVSLDDDIVRDVFELRKRDEYVRCSYAEIIRRLVKLGLDVVNNQADDQGA